MPNWFEPFPGLDVRFPEPGDDARFPAPGTDTRFATPGTDACFPAPGEDGRFGGASTPPGATSATMTSDDAWPEPGSTITVTKGTSGGTPVDGVLTLDGADVTDDATDTGPTLTYVVPAGGSSDRTLTWTPDTGAAVSMTIHPLIVTPATMTSPDAEPTEGSTVTITKGTQDGTPVDGVLTLDGVDVTCDATDTGDTLIYTVPDETITEMRTLLFTPITGLPVSRTIFGNTWEALTQPGTSYNPAAPEWRDAVNWR